jgi:arylsulfatase A-like enzyme
LWVHYFDPHEPYHLRKEFASPKPSGTPRPTKWDDGETRKRTRRYDSEIGYADHHIGRVLDKIDRMGLRETTLVVLTSDHGEALGEHGYVGHNRQLYEGIIRIPLIIRFPGETRTGQVVSEPVTLLDVTPTILELALPKDIEKLPTSFAGLSLAPSLLTGNRLPARPMRYLTFSSRKGFAPQWISWMWASRADLPLRLGKTENDRKIVWAPAEKDLFAVDLNSDPWGEDPRGLAESDGEYKRETAALQRWFESTDLEESEVKLSQRDTEVLKSLGYIQ